MTLMTLELVAYKYTFNFNRRFYLHTKIKIKAD